MTGFVFPFGQHTESVWAETQGELEDLALLLESVADTKIYVGPNPHDGLATDTMVNLDDWK